MTLAFKKYVILALGTAAFIHIGLTVTSYFAEDSSVLKPYTNEIFFQRWNFFAPDPGIITEKFWVKCEGGQDDEWMDPIQEILDRSYYSPLPSDYRRTYALRELSARLNKALNETTKNECKVSTNSRTFREQMSRDDLLLKEIPVCQKALNKVRKSRPYKELVKVSRKICAKRHPKVVQLEPKIIVSQKHPWPLTARGQRSDTNPYYKLSVVDFEKGVGTCSGL